jgi:hypothetical protein
VVLAWQRRTRHGHYSHSLTDSSKENQLEPGHTLTVEHCTTPDGGTPGYFYFIRRSLIFIYLGITCNNGVKYCRPSWNKRGGYGRRWRRGWRPSGRGWQPSGRPSGRGWSRCFSTCKVLAPLRVYLCHCCYSLHLLRQLLL